MSEEYPLKPTEADFDQESVDRQDAVMAWQSDEPILTFGGEPPALRDEVVAAAIDYVERGPRSNGAWERLFDAVAALKDSR